MTRLLITGGGGFIGRHVLSHLAGSDEEIHATTHTALSDDRVQTWEVDLLDTDATASLIEEVRPTHLLHLAWYTEHGAYWTSPENARWAEASLALARQFVNCGGQRLVVAGSCAEYDWTARACHAEDSAGSPATPYGATKLGLYRSLSELAEASDLSMAWGRVFFTHGPHESPARLLPSVIRSLLRGERARTTSGTQQRDFLHVTDVAAAFVGLLRSDIDGAVNIASGTATSLADVITYVAERLGGTRLLDIGALPTRAGDPESLYGSSDRLRSTGWVPSLSLEQGLDATVDWWKEHVSR